MRERGFTLIELLMVIAIIGILASTVLMMTAPTRAKSRDAKRIAELRNFEVGLAIYYDKYGVYPCGDADNNNPAANNPGGTSDSSGSCPANGQTDEAGFLNGNLDGSGFPIAVNCNAALGPQQGLFHEQLLPNNCPRDPVNTTTAPVMSYVYQASADRQTYLLSAYLENGALLMQNDGGSCDDAYEVGPAKGTIISLFPGTPGVCL